MVEEPPPLPPAGSGSVSASGGASPPAAEPSDSPAPADSWEAEAEDPLLTPDQDEEEQGDDLEVEGDEEIVKVPKKKTPKPEETKSKKEHVNVVFIGHVDAGKSTIGGQIMSLTGMVDKRTLEKYEREAREKSRESWYLSWALDTNQEGTKINQTLILTVILVPLIVMKLYFIFQKETKVKQ